MNEPDASEWRTATREGARAEMRRDVAAVSPMQRLVWLEQALQLALECGALSRVRRDRQELCDAQWCSGPGPTGP